LPAALDADGIKVPLPAGIAARWQLRASSPADISAAEAGQAERLLRG
jgi:hypothetical protein